MWTIPIAIVTAALDLRIKSGIESQDAENSPQPLGRGHVTLERLHNPGFSLQKGAEYPDLVRSVVTVFFTGFLVKYILAVKKRGSAANRLGLALVVGGAASNLIDRWRLGYVVDYLRFSPKRIHHLVMNLGDLAVVSGTLLNLISDLRDLGASKKAGA